MFTEGGQIGMDEGGSQALELTACLHILILAWKRWSSTGPRYVQLICIVRLHSRSDEELIEAVWSLISIDIGRNMFTITKINHIR